MTNQMDQEVEEAFQDYDMHEWERERWLEKYPENGEQMWHAERARLKDVLIEAVRRQERERVYEEQERPIPIVVPRTVGPHVRARSSEEAGDGG